MLIAEQQVLAVEFGGRDHVNPEMHIGQRASEIGGVGGRSGGSRSEVRRDGS
jgi:hypothetical protein